MSTGTELRDAAQSLAVDWMTASVMAAFERAGVASILLRGPAIASLLYRDGAVRSYHDCDVLSAPDDFERAEATLRGCGFQPYDQDEPGFVPIDDGGRPWLRDADGGNVDLHRRITFVAPERQALAWQLLSAGTRTISVSGAPVRALDEARTALVIGLHAARHGPHPKMIEDLSRAIQQLDRRAWSEAAELARALDVQPALATGLHLLPEGRELSEALGLGPASSVDGWLAITGASQGAVAVEDMLRQAGLRRRAAFAAARISPSPRFMRQHRSLARRGRRGLVAAYALRIANIATSTPAALRSWHRARRAATGAGR